MPVDCRGNPHDAVACLFTLQDRQAVNRLYNRKTPILQDNLQGEAYAAGIIQVSLRCGTAVM